MYPRVRVVLVTDYGHYHLKRFLAIHIRDIPTIFTLQMGHTRVIDVQAIHVVDLKITIGRIKKHTVFSEVFQVLF